MQLNAGKNKEPTLIRVSVIQMTPDAQLSRNLAVAEDLLRRCIVADRPDIVCLPECWTCIGAEHAQVLAQGQRFPRPATQESGTIAYEFLRGIAKEYGVVVHGGSMGELAEDRLFNTTVAFGKDGRELARYRKIHMADVVMPDGTAARESDRYSPGDQAVVYDTGTLKVGCAICYDLRFAELFISLRRSGAELIFVPSVFPLQSGKDHWETLLRARAIEIQCWIAAADTYGSYTNSSGTYHTYGHSLICNPWGHVVARASDGIGWATASVDRALTAKVRREIPVMQHRKPFIAAAESA